MEIMAELQSFDSSTDLGAGGLVDYFLRGGGNSGSKHGMVWIMIGAHKGYTKDGFLKPQTQRLRWIMQVQRTKTRPKALVLNTADERSRIDF